MSEEKQHYLSFLLRIWQIEENEHSTWRASLENVQSRERFGFADLNSLNAYLKDQVAAISDKDVHIAKDDVRQ